MKQIILITLFATGALLGTGPTYGQKLYEDAATHGIIFDCSPGSLMPPKMVSSVKIYTANTLATNTAFILGSKAASDAANTKIYSKLEFAPDDLKNDATLGNNGGVSWADAYNNCKKLTHQGRTGWRLPTQREVVIMWLFQGPMQTISQAFFKDQPYWSATENSEDKVWVVNFDWRKDGYMYIQNKTELYNVRCVREL